MKHLISLILILLTFTFPVYAQDDDLTETYTSELGDIIVSYPEGWQAVNESGLIILINTDPDTINEEIIPTGVAAIVLLPSEFLTLFQVEAGATPAEAIEVLAELVDQDFGEVGDLEEITLDNDAENEMIFASVRDEVGDGLIAAIGYEAGTVGVLAFTAPGEFAEYETLFFDMLSTLVYQEAPQGNPISWDSGNVTLSASNFFIVAGGNTFYADGDDVEVTGNPGDETSTTLEVTWQEHDVEMRIHMAFEADGETWHAAELRFYDGTEDVYWFIDDEAFFASPLGEAFTSDDFSQQFGFFRVYFDGLEVQAFTAE